MDYLESYEYWSNDLYFDAATRNELASIKDRREIMERFYKNLEFGTGGLRGIIGAGTNRMNIYTVARATQGLCNYILASVASSAREGGADHMPPLCIVVAYDSRRLSKEFAERVALVAAGNGIRAYVFPEIAPTPVLSFAIRRLGCISGVVITASHNPPEYNGYKAYWSDGGQVPYPRDEEIIRCVDAITSYDEIKIADRAHAEADGLFLTTPREVTDDYINIIKEYAVDADVINKYGGSLTIVYTPLNGTGNVPVRRVLSEFGFDGVRVVPEQEGPDPNFTTVGYPNPEDPKAFVLAKKLAAQIDADIIIATDPDADRVGVVAKDKTGGYAHLSGNMTGTLLTHYILSHKKANGTLPDNAAVVSTIVSTKITREIAEKFGAAYFDVLTGFKYIGEKIKEFEESGSHSYAFGFEESFGYLPGPYARDKDGVATTMLVCELAAYYKRRGMTLFDGLDEIFNEYGYYKESTKTITHEGVEGAERIKAIMDSLRENEILTIGGAPVTETRDYKTGIEKNTATGAEKKITLPVSDVLYYATGDGSWFCVRPSGTEPKIKMYFGVRAESAGDADKKLESFMREASALLGK